MLLSGLQGGDRRAKTAAGHHAGCFCSGTGGQLQRPRQLIGQPLAALGQGLGVGEHLAGALLAATAQQGMANWQHQGPHHGQVGVFPEGIEAGGHAPFHGVFHRHHGRVAVALGQGLHHGADT